MRTSPSRLYGAIGNQYVERFTNYGIGNNNYWDWQIGFTATVYGVDLTIAYIDTNLDVPYCRQHHELRRRGQSSPSARRSESSGPRASSALIPRSPCSSPLKTDQREIFAFRPSLTGEA